MHIAIQEDMLPGRTIADKFENARRLGIAGIEVWAEGLSARVPEIVAAIQQTGVQVAMVNLGRSGSLLDPDPAAREQVLVKMRVAMGDAIDLGAERVIFVPHYGPPLLPDLWPYKSILQLEAEMLTAYFRKIFSDLAYAMGMKYYILPVNHYESHFVNTIAQAATIREHTNDRKHLRLAVSLFHMLLEETDIPLALTEQAAHIDYVYLSDNNHQLPGQGTADFATFAASLSAMGYDGWLTLECGEPGQNQDRARQIMADLPGCLDFLRAAGFALTQESG